MTCIMPAGKTTSFDSTRSRQTFSAKVRTKGPACVSAVTVVAGNPPSERFLRWSLVSYEPSAIS